MIILQIGSYVDGKYKVLSKIGQGGMSEVYLVLNEKANKTWAIKEVRKDSSREFLPAGQRLLAEIAILKELDHRYLPDIIDIIDDGESVLIVMDYIQGESLDRILRERMEKAGRPLALGEVLSLGKQLCEVLLYLHTQPDRIIYRDLKPGNIIWKPDGEISLIDFGTARRFRQGNCEDTICLGTPGYASPEQYGGSGQSTIQSDIYCLGATLHHLITGRDPAPSPFYFPRITSCRPGLLEEVPRVERNKLLGLELILERCTQYAPEKRYGSCLEILYDLEHVEELSLPFRKKIQKKLCIFGISVAITMVCGGILLGTAIAERRTGENGYAYCVDQAEKSPDDGKKIYARKAIEMNPAREEGYLIYLDTLRKEEFSGQDSQEFKALLQQTSGKKSYEEFLAGNREGYVRVAYELGMAYFFAGGAGKPAGDKEVAGKWFGIVAQSVLPEKELKSLGLEKEEALSQEKIRKYDIDPELVRTFLSICRYYERIGQEDQTTGEIVYSYRDFWEELEGLVNRLPQEISTESRRRLTQLRLLEDVTWQLNKHAKAFVSDAGVGRVEFQNFLGQIEEKTAGADTGSNRMAQVLQDNILVNISATGKLIKTLYGERG